MPHRRRLIQPLLQADLPGSQLSDWVLSFVRQEELFRGGDRVLVAVSGGPDSVALLHLLAGWRQELGLELAVGHFDHGLRRESQEEAAWVAGLAERLKLPFHPGRGAVKELARTSRLSLQMAARKLRLGFLREVCVVHGYQKLALGHTADDQVELFFLRLLRGAGPGGLKGMWPATPEGAVRPLLAVGKAPLLAWLEEQGIPYRRDPSNLSRAYLRNRVRLDLLPELLRLYNPRLREAVWRGQALLQEDERLLAGETGRLLTQVGRCPAQDFYYLDLGQLRALDYPWQLRVLRAAVAKVAGEAGLTAAQTAALLDLAWGGKSGGLISLGQARAARAGPELHLFRDFPPSPGGALALPVVPQGNLESPEGWNWTWSSRPRPGPGFTPPGPQAAALNRERLIWPLQVRYFRAGDRFWPLGAPGPRKLQDFLVDCKIPRWLRPHIPLVVSGGQIVWVAGLRTAEPLKVGSAGGAVLTLAVSPTRPETRRLWEVILDCRKRQA